MPFDNANLDEYGPGDRLGSQRHNKLISAVNGLMDITAKNLGVVRDPAAPVVITDIFTALIRAKGPNGEADYTDNRYWFDVSLPDSTLGATDLVTITADAIFPEAATATNFGEAATTNPTTAATHRLSVGTKILVFALQSRSSTPVPIFIFTQAPVAITLFPVLTTQTSGSAGNTTTACTFMYTVTDYFTSATLGTGIGLETPRYLKVAMNAATNGTAFWGMSGTTRVVKLWQAFEIAAQTSCT